MDNLTNQYDSIVLIREIEKLKVSYLLSNKNEYSSICDLLLNKINQ